MQVSDYGANRVGWILPSTGASPSPMSGPGRPVEGTRPSAPPRDLTDAAQLSSASAAATEGSSPRGAVSPEVQATAAKIALHANPLANLASRVAAFFFGGGSGGKTPATAPAQVSAVGQTAPPAAVQQPASAGIAEPRALLPNGQSIPPSSYHGGYHGTSEVSPDVALRDGLPARGDDWRLQEHTESRSASAFRGTTPVIYDPVTGNGASAWAGDGGWVYEIRNVPTWDTNSLLDGRVQRPDGSFRGNLMVGENEMSIPARVAPENIKRCGRVTESVSGRLTISEWIENPGYTGPR